MRCCSKLVLLTAVSAAAVSGGPDPDCSTGIRDGDICCAKECGTCGGPGCSKLPEGSSACCSGSIKSSGRSCSSDPPPCMIGGSGGWPPAPTNKTVSVSLAVAAGVVREVSERFVSYNLDSGWWDTDRYDLTDPTLLLLSGGLGPAHLRVGGTGEDYLVYTIGEFANFSCASPPPPMTSFRCIGIDEAAFTRLFNFASASKATVLFGISDMFGRPTKTLKPENPLCSDSSCPPINLTNAETLVKWIAASDVAREAMFAFELGNELNSVLNGKVGAETQAEDLVALAAVVDAAWPKKSTLPKLCGPDTHSSTEYQTKGLEWLSNWGKKITSQPSSRFDQSRLITTFHMYALGSGTTKGLETFFLDASKLDNVGVGVRAVQSAVGAAAKTLYAGETAAANNGGKAGVTDTFLDSYWYADQLGQYAAGGVSVFQRQVLIASGGYPLIRALSSTEFQPNPDYWVALLFSRLMGTGVLNVTVAKEDKSRLRAYAHCNDTADMTLLLINLSPDTLRISPSAVIPAANNREEWHLTPGSPMSGLSRLQSQSVVLNGASEPLAVLPGPSLPPLEGMAMDGASPITLSAQSIAFVSVGKQSQLCAK